MPLFDYAPTKYLRISLLGLFFIFQMMTSAQDANLDLPINLADTFPHYPIDGHLVIPTDIEADLDASFPKLGAAFGTVIPRRWFNWKTDLYDKVGLKLGVSYQTLFQGTSTSNTRTDTSFNKGWGGWFLLEAQWKLFNKEDDWEGSISIALDGRHLLSNKNTTVMPGDLFFETGTMWGHDAFMLPWDPYAAILFWEQHGKKDRFWIRVGQIAGPAILDFFRYKDGRVSFTSPAMTFPLHIIPYSAPGFGVAFNWYPIQNSELYVTGIMNDLNANAGVFDWSGIFEYGDIFAGLEVGKHWRRSNTDFDHAHITFWYSDERSTSPIPTKSGWGFKVHGTKQWDNMVSFANYSYNTTQGGGFGIFAIAQHGINAGLAFVAPLDVRGEIGMALSWAVPIRERAEFLGARTEAQLGGEIYWRILMLKQFWITPGMQFTVNPTYNVRTDFIFVPQIKARLFI